MPDSPGTTALIRLLLHELRSPLNVLAGSLGHLTDGRAGDLTPDQQRIADRARRAAGDLDRLCAQVRSWVAATDEGSGGARTPLGPALAAAAAAATARAEGRVEFSTPPAIPDLLVAAPAQALEAALQAVLDAVARAAASGGTIPVVVVASGTAPAEVRVGELDGTTADAGFDVETVGGLGFALPLASAVIAGAGGRLWSRSEGRRVLGIGIELPR
jgi:signal transduction histidine kinase